MRTVMNTFDFLSAQLLNLLTFPSHQHQMPAQISDYFCFMKIRPFFVVFVQKPLKSFDKQRKILEQLFTNLLNKYSMKEPNLCAPEPAHLFLYPRIKEFSFSKNLLIIHLRRLNVQTNINNKLKMLKM